jgi:sugar lactone lactonase YvrE
MTRPRPSPLRALPLVVAAGVAGLAGCAAPQRPDVRWPPPPAVARVEYVRSIRSGEDLVTSPWRSFWRSLLHDQTAGVVDMPTGVALSVDERTLYVVSPASGSIPVLAVDLAAEEIRRFADVRETRPRSPFGVAVDGDDQVWITDSSANAVVVYTRTGNLVRKVTEAIERPTGIAIDRHRRLVYVVSGVSRESERHRVEVYTVEGAHVRTIGTRGAGAGEFNFPGHLAVSPGGNLLVSDMLNFRVQEFDPDGALVGMFGTQGRGPGAFDKAKGIAFDTFGNVYVVDGEQAVIQIFNDRRQVLMGFGGRLELPGFLTVPTAIAIDSRNTIYVADYANRAVNEYRLVNTTAADSHPEDRPGPSPLSRDGAHVR